MLTFEISFQMAHCIQLTLNTAEAVSIQPSPLACWAEDLDQNSLVCL